MSRPTLCSWAPFGWPARWGLPLPSPPPVEAPAALRPHPRGTGRDAAEASAARAAAPLACAGAAGDGCAVWRRRPSGCPHRPSAAAVPRPAQLQLPRRRRDHAERQCEQQQPAGPQARERPAHDPARALRARLGQRRPHRLLRDPDSAVSGAGCCLKPGAFGDRVSLGSSECMGMGSWQWACLAQSGCPSPSVAGAPE